MIFRQVGFFQKMEFDSEFLERFHVTKMKQMEKMQKWKMELLQFSWARVVGFQSFYVGPQYATTIKKTLPGLLSTDRLFTFQMYLEYPWPS